MIINTNQQDETKIELTKEKVLEILLSKYPTLTENDIFHGKYITTIAQKLLQGEKLINLSWYNYDTSIANLRKLVVYNQDMKNPENAHKLAKFLDNDDKCLMYFVINYQNSVNYFQEGSAGIIGIPPKAREILMNTDTHFSGDLDKYIEDTINTCTFYIYGKTFEALDNLCLPDDKLAQMIENKINK